MKNNWPFVFALLSIFTIFFSPLRDTDFGWHYRCGELALKHRQLCDTNNFTSLLEGYRWFSPSHGYQILLYLTFSTLGFLGVNFLYGLLTALVVTIFLKSLKINLLLSLTLFSLLTWFSWGVWGLGLRSQIFSLYFLMILLSLIEWSEFKPRLLLASIPLMFLWSNSHSGFFLGNLLLTLWLLRSVVNHLWGKTKKVVIWKAILIYLLANLATLINPYGWGIYQEAWRHSQVAMNGLIAEWVAPQPWQVNIILLSTLLVLVLTLAKTSFDPLRLTFLMLSAYLAIQARRNLPIFSTALIYALSEVKIRETINRLSQRFTFPEIIIAFLVLVLTVTLPGNFRLALTQNEDSYCQESVYPLPCRGLRFLSSQKPGYIFNTYEWGGYLIWKLPDFKVFVDGRMPSWDTSQETKLPDDWRGKSPYTIYIETLQAQNGWEKVLSNFETQYIFIQSGTYLDVVLRNSEAVKLGYQEIYNDGQAVIYQRT